jgi:tight adherence protein B
MDPTMLMLVTFLAVGLGIMGVYSLVSDLYLRDRARLSQRVDDEFRKRQREQVKKSTLFKNLAQLAGDSTETQEFKLNLSDRLQRMVERSGLNLTFRRLVLIIAGCGAAGVELGWVLGQSLVASVLVGVIGAGVPIFYVYRKAKNRREKLLVQLPDALDLMARIIRAGQTLMQGMQAIGDEFEQPIAAEFTYCYEQQHLGLPHEMAFRDLAERTNLLEVKILVLAVLVQQQTGGNLSQLLENLAMVIRERSRMRGKIKALTAEGRMQAMVLLALPPLVFSVMLIFNRGYAQLLLNHPTLLVVTVAVMGVGALWIRKIIRFDF